MKVLKGPPVDAATFKFESACRECNTRVEVVIADLHREHSQGPDDDGPSYFWLCPTCNEKSWVQRGTVPAWLLKTVVKP